jgi:arabinofuranosyltransferase
MRITRRALITVVALAAAAGGWRLFWFLTDDAYIAFRYASNALFGRGLVWNPAPFLPVEGYTSFLWVVLLELVWRVTGLEPPAVANWLSLGFGWGSLLIGIRAVERLSLPERLARHRTWILIIVLAGVLTNRTFLAWLSSGLETSLFNFCVLWWLFAALAPAGSRGMWWTASLSASAAACALTRPDGLIVFGASILILLHHGRRTGQRGWRWAGCGTLLAVPGHLIWRRQTYGEWLPNTYYAKHVAAWPEAGWRYLASFVVEYGVWVWLIALGILTVSFLRSRRRGLKLGENLHACAAIAALLAHAGYYTLVIGGDHFEYRIYSHLIIPLFVSFVWIVSRISLRPAVLFASLLVFLSVSWPVPWIHWARTRNLETRTETHFLFREIAPAFPAFLRPAVSAWDGWQSWLTEHRVCVRHQEHKVFYDYQIRSWITREQGLEIPWSERNVLAHGTVGVPGWMLPHVAIIDLAGLNDRVIARHPVEPDKIRLMAHDRSPPPGYVACYRPNVTLEVHGPKIMIRREPLTDDEIRACEEAWNK